MVVFINGEFVPAEHATVSVFDRGFLYGDGLFETIRVYQGRPFRWQQHLERFLRGADFLGIQPTFSTSQLTGAVMELIQRNRIPESLLRLNLSRGIGPRGYSTKGADSPTLVITLHPAPAFDPSNPPRWRLITSSYRVPSDDPVALHKTCNKLPQILARAEAEAQGADEALLLNTSGEVAEAASGNCFWVEGGVVCTTPLISGILAGVTRAFVLELCESLKLSVCEKAIRPKTLLLADGVFLTMSSLEVVPVISLDGTALPVSPLVEKIQIAYRQAVLA